MAALNAVVSGDRQLTLSDRLARANETLADTASRLNNLSNRAGQYPQQAQKDATPSTPREANLQTHVEDTENAVSRLQEIASRLERIA